MDQKEVLQATERAGFADLNGQIMRMCNILKPSQRTLNAVYSLCKNNPNFAYTEEQIVQSIGYLCDGGYLAIARSSVPWAATRALLEVTTCLPAIRQAFTNG